jgi:hypothetical protein
LRTPEVPQGCLYLAVKMADNTEAISAI